jgi:hypothetical protein
MGILENIGENGLVILFTAIIVMTYLPTFVLSLIFTFSIDLFEKIERKMGNESYLLSTGYFFGYKYNLF